MVSFRDIFTGLKQLDIDPDRPVIVHASLSAFGEVRGGAEGLLGALLAAFRPVMMPTFTYSTMLIPEDGPQDNGIRYGSGKDRNRMAEIHRPDLPADSLMGVTAEALRRHPSASRSQHPILSFAGVQVESLLARQSLVEPLGPIAALQERAGWVLLLGTDHTCNTSLHYAEKLAGRKQFIRWALTPSGVRECPGWPGCSDGFEGVAPHLERITRRLQVGSAEVRALPLVEMTAIVTSLIQQDPLALLCSRDDCERCQAVRNDLQIPIDG